MNNFKLKVIKENGVPQRTDVTLSKTIANALMRKILSGETLFPKGGELSFSVLDGESQKTFVIPRGTLNTWITRDNVIPETGKTLREVLDKAREEYRINKREEKINAMVEDAETKLHRALKIRTKQPVINASGVVRDKDTGEILRRENPALLRTQIDTAKYVTERLDPERYGKVSKKESKKLVFSLSELRKYEEEQRARL